MKAVQLKDLKKGEFFVLSPSLIKNDEVDSCFVFVKGSYERSIKKYSCHRFEDVNSERFYNGFRIVYVDFIF